MHANFWDDTSVPMEKWRLQAGSRPDASARGRARRRAWASGSRARGRPLRDRRPPARPALEVRA